MRTTKAQRRANHQRLSTLELFARCTSRQLDGIARLGTDIDVREGTRLCREHRTAPQFVVVVDGQVALYRGEHKIGVVHNGGWFGHGALLGGRPVEDLRDRLRNDPRPGVLSAGVHITPRYHA